ncbi:MAG TPA: Fic family protein [Candidatus Babeliales bacterium]|nr:Fic family protein [Candidatus Babeliales bacterium]
MEYEKLTHKKQKLDSLRPLPKDLIKNLTAWFRVELTYSSNALEGNTLTRQETALVIEKGITIGGKRLEEHLEATNHAKAFDWVLQFVQGNPTSITEKDIVTIHDIVLKGIDDDNAGHYRAIAVRISGSMTILPNYAKVPDLMAEYIVWLNTADLHPVVLAAQAHYKLVTIHPFVDGNGRTARLLMNLILMMHGYPPAVISVDDRLAYLKALEKAQTGGSQDDYLQLIARAVDHSLDIYLDALGV